MNERHVVWDRLLQGCGGKSVAEIGRCTGIHPEVLRHSVQRGSDSNLVLVATAFGISGDWLLYGEGPPHRSVNLEQETYSECFEEVSTQLNLHSGRLPRILRLPRLRAFE